MKKLALILFLFSSICYLKPVKGQSSTAPELLQNNYGEVKKELPVNEEDLLNKPAPDFKLNDITGKTYALSELKGKVVVLNFWFILCKPCVAEMTKLNLIKNSYDPDKVIFLALSLDNAAAIHSFLQTHPFGYQILPDATKTGELFHIYAYPTSMVIDKRGIIRFIQVGGPNIEGNLPLAIDKVLR